MGDRIGQPTRRHEPYLPHHRRQGCSCLTGISLQLAVCSPEQLSETSAHPRVQSKVRVEEGEEETEREREQEKAEEGGKEMGRKWKRAKKRKRLRRKEGKKGEKRKVVTGFAVFLHSAQPWNPRGCTILENQQSLQ